MAILFHLVILIFDTVMISFCFLLYLLVLNNAGFFSLVCFVICDCDFIIQELFCENSLSPGLKLSFCREHLLLLLSGIQRHYLTPSKLHFGSKLIHINQDASLQSHLLLCAQIFLFPLRSEAIFLTNDWKRQGRKSGSTLLFSLSMIVFSRTPQIQRAKNPTFS